MVPVVVKEWTDVGNKTTEPFNIDGRVWVILYFFTPEPVVGIYAKLIMVDVKKPNNNFYTNSPIGIANVNKPISDHTYIYDMGTFYLDIVSMDGTWSIKVIAFE